MSTALTSAPATRPDVYRLSPDQCRRVIAAGVVTRADEAGVLAGRYRFSVDQYHKLDDLGVLDPENRVELLDGLLIRRPDMHPPHATAVENTWESIRSLLPAGWTTRSQLPVTLPTSQPHPDVAVVRGTRADYRTRHPGPPDIGLLVEVADSSRRQDRTDKAFLYAAAGVVVYWIVNLVHHQVEVMTGPTPTGYLAVVTHPAGDAVPLSLYGVALGSMAVNELIV